MDNQFTTLTRSYHDNYLEYKVTGNSSYQNSFQSAEEGIQNIISSLQDQVNTQNEQINNFYSSNAEEKLRDTQSKIKMEQRSMIKDKDQVTGAIMRSTPASFQIPQSYLISIGVLTGVVVLLLALK
jgi:peptidoglycan hydrolase CwlO-like protein